MPGTMYPSAMGSIQLIQDITMKTEQIWNYFVEAKENVVIKFVFHPFVAANTLIRLGYEPFPPLKINSYFTRRSSWFILPGTIPYGRYLWMVEGFPGIYHFAIPSMANKLVANYTSLYIKSISPYPGIVEYYNVNPPLYERFTNQNLLNFANRRWWVFLGNAAATILSHPFHVIAIQGIAEIVSPSDKIRLPLKGLMEVLKNKGAFGLFSGLIPRLIGDAARALTSSLLYITVMRFLQSRNWQNSPDRIRTVELIEKFTLLLSNHIADLHSNQFYNVSDIMIANGTLLPLGNPPFTPIYKGWLDCWISLPPYKLQRTVSLLTRPYMGQLVVSNNGDIMPIGEYYGPTYFPTDIQKIPWLLEQYYVGLTSSNLESKTSAQLPTYLLLDHDSVNSISYKMHSS